jgi:DNA end-binding protein Ku
MKMALQLVEDMTEPWDADNFRNSFADEIHKLVESKANKGKLVNVAKIDHGDEVTTSADVVDLTALLKRSLEGKGNRPKPDKPASVTKLPATRVKVPAKTASKAMTEGSGKVTTTTSKRVTSKSASTARSAQSAKTPARKRA